MPGIREKWYRRFYRELIELKGSGRYAPVFYPLFKRYTIPGGTIFTLIKIKYHENHCILYLYLFYFHGLYVRCVKCA
jgi:hypothetical protein